MILHNLFQDFPLDRLRIYCAHYMYKRALRKGVLLPHKHDLIALPPHTVRVIGRLFKFLDVLCVPWIVLYCVVLIKKHKIDTIFTVPYRGEFFVAAYFAHLLSRTKFYVYVMDDWEAHVRQGHAPHRLLTWLVGQARILRAADKVWAVSRPMAQLYEEHYGIRVSWLPHTIHLDRYRRPASRPGRIVFTGSIYGAQLDPLQRLARVVSSASWSDSTVELVLYCDIADSILQMFGLTGPKIIHDCVPSDRIPEVLATADVLFLPFSFQPQQGRIVSTSLPTKVPEYLASGIPILVHAPAYSSIARYARDGGWGLVIDTPDECQLSDALGRMMHDRNLRGQLSEAALRCAATNHDSVQVAREFRRAFERVG
jgi:glycosyltransferase involved in cell wall biosynthesis